MGRDLFFRAVVAALLLGFSTHLFGDVAEIETNAKLAATMSNLANDLGVVTAPTKKPTAAEVPASMILNAIVRARTAGFLLQTAIDRAGKIDNGVFRRGELTPPDVAAIPVDELALKLDLYGRYLKSAQEKFAEADAQLSAQLEIQDPSLRDFAPVAQTLKELGAIIGAAHGAFKPKKPAPPDRE